MEELYEHCMVRKAYANFFDMHFTCEDCPVPCEAYLHEKNDIRASNISNNGNTK